MKLLFGLAACASHPAPVAPIVSEEVPVATPLTERPTVSMQEGPSISPTSALVAWLDEHAKGGRLVALPVTVVFDDAYKLGIVDAVVGGGDDALHLELDDAAMSIGLLDVLRGKCAADATSCAVWLDGTWGPLVARRGPPPPGGFRGPTFAVRRVGDGFVGDVERIRVQ